MNEGSLTVLEEMQIGHRYLHPPAVGVVDGPERLNQRRVSFVGVPKLRCLLLDNFPYRCTAPSLTTLRLYGVAIETCVDLLFECAGIIDFECRRPNVSDNGIDYPLQATKAVVKKQLRLFEWDFDFANAEWYNDFYTCIRMPRLQRMRLTNIDADPSPFPPSLLTFLESVSSTLKRLTLVTFRVTDSQDVNDIFACVPRIEHLVVEERGNATYSCYREILQALNLLRLYLKHLPP
ncbi:hypothetical protein D9756_011078 [Leucocoprinus leucothites]|uniref:Uncharacterized protein n=1 Tax=Leucocoprinus leucothites TaxID=201217 RepID=A0A8H5CN03_9AGAR|nr:hypothetical protein D9756_011078 [Leucoagaricus leucothites]